MDCFRSPTTKDRRNQRSAFGDAAALTPGPDEQRYQRPLRPARVLELVEQHMVIPPLEPVSAARELVHLREQRQRLGERLGEIEHPVRIEGVPILAKRDLIDALHGSRQTPRSDRA